MLFERVNLVPRKPLAEKIRKLVPVVIIVLLTGIGLFFTLQYNMLQRDIRRNRTNIAAIQVGKEQANTLIAMRTALNQEISRLEKQRNQLVESIAKIAEVADGKKHYTTLLRIISDLIPATVICDTFAVNGRNGTITGRAINYKDLPELIIELNSQAIFSEVVLQDIDRTTAEEYSPLNFRILFTLAQPEAQEENEPS